MKKFVLKLDLHDDKDKRKALKTVSTLAGIDSISMDMKGHKLTVIGTVDPITIVSKLRKFWPAEIILVGPAKEPEKKDPKKDGEAEKEEAKKGDSKKEGDKKEDYVIGMMPNRPYYPYMNGMPYPPVNTYRPYYPPQNAPVNTMPYRPYYPQPSTYYYANHSIEENPNGCVIC